MLHNGKPQTCSAGLSGMAFVYPVKALKDPSLFTFRDSDPVICHTVERMPFPVAYHDPHMSILLCIADCIVCNVEKHLIEHMADALDLLCISGKLKGNIFLSGRVSEIISYIFCKLLEIHLFKRDLTVAFIQPGKLDDIRYQIGKSY